MDFLIGNCFIQPDDVTYSQIAYGRSACVDLHDFRMELDISEFISVFNPMYDECIVELKRDDGITGEFDEPYPGAHDYPSLENFIQEGNVYFFKFFKTYFKSDFLGLFFFEEKVDSPYLIVSIDGFLSDAARIVFFGKAGKVT